MRPNTAYWKAYWCSYWHIREKLAQGKQQNRALGAFLAKPYYENEAKAELIRLNQLRKTAQAA